KSTLARLVVAGAPRLIIRLLDDAATLNPAREGPADFVAHDGLMVIDEGQLAPELFPAIKAKVDLDPGSGSSSSPAPRILTLRDLPDALPGRMETIELWPCSQGEIDGTPDQPAPATQPGLTRTAHSWILAPTG